MKDIEIKETGPMSQATIRKICRAKLEHWIRSIPKVDGDSRGPVEDPICKVIRENTIITGGAIASMLMGERVNDFDVYFRTAEAAEQIANYYVDLFKKHNKDWTHNFISKFEVCRTEGRVRVHIKSAGVVSTDGSEKDTLIKNTGVITPHDDEDSVQPDTNEGDDDAPSYQYFERAGGDEAAEYLNSVASRAKKGKDGEHKPYTPLFITDNAITLSNQIQLVMRFCGEPNEIHKNYDFIHCTNYWTSWEDKLVLSMDAMESLRTKSLYYCGSLYPICSVIRLRKFIKRGWKINAGQILKMMYQVSKLNMDDPNILREQLVGVDSAYFHELIQMMVKDGVGIEGKTIDQTYLANLIDTIFEDKEEDCQHE